MLNPVLFISVGLTIFVVGFSKVPESSKAKTSITISLFAGVGGKDKLEDWD